QWPVIRRRPIRCRRPNQSGSDFLVVQSFLVAAWRIPPSKNPGARTNLPTGVKACVLIS
ncbi:hypothetical protein HMPREF0511_0767, partial [Limosilactobacillus fermentum ATCC 14931]